jgi:hypothetical protein
MIMIIYIMLLSLYSTIHFFFCIMQMQKMSQAVEEKVEGLQHQKGQDVALQAALAARGLGGSWTWKESESLVVHGETWEK